MMIRRLDHVKIARWGEDDFQVVGEDSRHFQVINVTRGTKNPEPIYKVHCHVPVAMARANHQRRVERANEIGRPR